MSSNFSGKERRIANFLNRFPIIKIFAKKTYQYFNHFVCKKNYSIKSDYKIEKLPFQKEESFFGYYDKSPISENNKYILVHTSTYSSKKIPNPKFPLKIKLFSLTENKVVNEFESSAYNWQQGSKAQWLDEKKFIFNNFSDNKFEAVIVNVEDDRVSRIPIPIYDCFKDQYALTLNFERLMALRPDYGYRNLSKLNEEKLREVENDGIFFFDFSTLEVSLLISISSLLKIDFKLEMKEALHKVNHIMISPSGNRFMFLHRYFVDGRRFDRLFVAKKDGSDIKLLLDHNMVSHCCWMNDTEILGYFRHPSNGDCYYKIDVLSKEVSVIGNSVLSKFGDGHPSVCGNFILLDTYPDKARMKHIFLYNVKSNQIFELGEFYESLEYYGETRCDLHPRFSTDGKKVFFDSVHEGTRGLYWIDLNEIVK
jgi:hypothetical protein